jgi:hypothetical protein
MKLTHRELNKVREELKSTSSKRLQDLLTLIEGYMSELQDRSGFRGSLLLLVRFHKDARRAPNKVFHLPKWLLEQEFTNYAACFPGWDLYPPHAMVPIDTSGNVEWGIWHGVILPEALVYEDMCASYNLAVRTEKDRFSALASKVAIKTHNMAVRTSILAAYYFVEAYLNAVAFDFWSVERGNLTHEEIDFLQEMDSKKHRQRWLSFEMKTNRYPRIILRAQHCPLTESNCEQLKYLLNEGKKIRDSIVHPSPKIDPLSLWQEKAGRIMGVEISQATAAVDSAIGYVRQLNGVLGTHGCDL